MWRAKFDIVVYDLPHMSQTHGLLCVCLLKVCTRCASALENIAPHVWHTCDTCRLFCFGGRVQRLCNIPARNRDISGLGNLREVM